MPKTRLERAVFGILMTLAMVYGMEVYNAAIRDGTMTNSLFAVPIGELFLLGAIVMMLQELIGGPLARKLAFRLIDPSVDKPFVVTVVIQVMTVCIMCPLMSMVATLMFKGIDSQVPAKWVQTVAINFPMALSWQIFVAGPLVRLIFKKLFIDRPLSPKSGIVDLKGSDGDGTSIAKQ